MNKNNNISTAFKFSKTDSKIIENIIEYEGTPEAILRFEKLSEQLSDYSVLVSFIDALGELYRLHRARKMETTF